MPKSNVKIILRPRPCAEKSHLQIDAAANVRTLVLLRRRRRCTHVRVQPTRLNRCPSCAAVQTVTISHARHSRVPGLPGASGKAGGSSQQQYQFTFDAVLHGGATQEEVYQLCAADMVASALEGLNGCVMAYGQTGVCAAPGQSTHALAHA
jgi:hypothetical protein